MSEKSDKLRAMLNSLFATCCLDCCLTSHAMMQNASSPGRSSAAM